ncbi:MAG: GNAT family acetyltransferase [Alphaproteobacteria bacterium]|nr:GNAT family acetyltransferase [Alphaproteobacteria bacterium]
MENELIGAASIQIRPYRPADRPSVRRICADTGFLGSPIDPVFEDRELFADYLTDYYLNREPDATLVCEVDGIVAGYLLGCRRPFHNSVYQALANVAIAGKALYRCIRRPYGRASRGFLRWILTRARREVPAAPRLTPHFHLNLLPRARSIRGTRALIQAFLAFLHREGHESVYGQMVTFGTRRHNRLFERFGFQVAERREITKYRGLHSERVYLSTIIRDLRSGARLVSAHRVVQLEKTGRYLTTQTANGAQ